MKPNDMAQFLKLITATGEVYSKNISEEMAEIYWQSLEQFEFNQIKNAFKLHVNDHENGRFFPKIIDITRFIQDSNQIKSDKAWGAVLDAIGRVGSYDNVVFDDVTIHLVIKNMGGWVQLCQSQTTQLDFKSKEFKKLYINFTISPPAQPPKYLNGIYGTETIFIEDKTKAQAIFKPN
jgi:hypothetical protein